MKTKFLPAVITSIAFIIVLSVITFSCQKDASNNQKKQSVDPTPDEIIAKAGADMPPYNLNVVMRSGTGEFAFVKFRQHADTARIINRDTWVPNLEPNHAYILLRAVDSLQHGGCFSTAWLTLGEGLTPTSIHSESKGYGFAPLWRDMTSLGRGTEFYIIFR